MNLTNAKMSLKPSVVALAGLTILATGSTSHAQSLQKQLYVRGVKQCINGVNMPWMTNNGGSNFGHDIGPNNFTGYPYSYRGADVDKYFQEIKNMRANVVRIWLFENLEGLNFDSSGYISGINSTFLTNLNDLLNRANNKGLAVELALFDFRIGNDFGKYPNKGGGAVKNFFKDYNAQNALINNVIKPLARAQNGKLSVFGYDLMNESNYAVEPGANQNLAASATWQEMHDWIYNLTGAIHSVNRNIQVTCSTDVASNFASNVHWNRYGGVGLDFYSYHNYSDNPNIFTVGSNGLYPSIDKPIILDEYGPTTLGDITLQQSVTNSYLYQASVKGWAGVSAWSYGTYDGWSIVYDLNGSGSNNFKPAAWTLQWYSINRFGL
jgi:hypothetical protein